MPLHHRQNDGRGVVAASNWPNFGRRAEEHPQRGVRATEPWRRPLFGVGMALSGQTAPCGALRENAHVEPPQPD